MWETILGAVVFGFLCIRYLFFHRQARRRNWYIIVGIVTGLASIGWLIRLGHLLGLWSFYL
ncbi:hypothetical protein [Sulfobacillus harzensis]|uniref:Uncharacterized protein n=1 Tax=Sulfobacillus harzensis TaxID=2729629 RepID=A0A7Y0Q4R1_9FIRM|nr:hypothetical protein [Sulfobacillus harzensis]NMP24301.1 hypothetical protein [Sulfobacillus harzensis]